MFYDFIVKEAPSVIDYYGADVPKIVEGDDGIVSFAIEPTHKLNFNKPRPNKP